MEMLSIVLRVSLQGNILHLLIEQSVPHPLEVCKIIPWKQYPRKVVFQVHMLLSRNYGGFHPGHLNVV